MATKLPQYSGTNVSSWGTYIDDTYRLGNRITMNLGVRYDYSRGFFPSFPFLDAQGNQTGQVSAASTVERFKTVSPRLGLNFELFRQTIVKGHYGPVLQPDAARLRLARPLDDGDIVVQLRGSADLASGSTCRALRDSAPMRPAERSCPAQRPPTMWSIPTARTITPISIFSKSSRGSAKNSAFR